jgi:hypothetical protein
MSSVLTDTWGKQPLDARSWLEDIRTISELSQTELAAKLIELGDVQPGRQDRDVRGAPDSYSAPWWPSRDRAWRHTAHTVGFIPATRNRTARLRLISASAVSAETALKGARLKITLDRLQAADYPGGGTHTVLVDMAANTQSANRADDLHFAMTYPVRERQLAGLSNYPVFIGLPVGSEGLSLGLVTVNVCNEDDENFLKILNSGTLQAGLTLLHTWQPALAPLSELARGITIAISQRTRNVAVQKFMMGLDFSANPTGFRLAEGSYVAVQVPDALSVAWDWNQWVYDPGTGHIVSVSNPAQLIPFNYIAIGVSRYTDA